jgi:hypothetical protein
MGFKISIGLPGAPEGLGDADGLDEEDGEPEGLPDGLFVGVAEDEPLGLGVGLWPKALLGRTTTPTSRATSPAKRARAPSRPEPPLGVWNLAFI